MYLIIKFLPSIAPLIEGYVEAISDISDRRSRLKGECHYANIEFN